MSQTRQIRLGAFISGPGHHVAAWRHPQSKADGRFNFEHLKGVTQLAERGLFDAVFLADGLASRNRPSADGRTSGSAGFEPVTLFSALSAVTEHIGFIATASTTYEDCVKTSAWRGPKIASPLTAAGAKPAPLNSRSTAVPSRRRRSGTARARSGRVVCTLRTS